jgi:hypothetical protein
MEVYLDKVGTGGSFKLPPCQASSSSSGGVPPQKTQLEKFNKLKKKRDQNSHQVKELLKTAKEKTRNEQFILLKAASAIKFCSESFLMQKEGDQYKTLSAFHCGKKYCSICSARKRNKLIFRYLNFFESEDGMELQKKFDLAMFTVTLEHNTIDKRTEPYYKELSEHWRNGMKYGAFKKYLAGGFYNVEHTYTKNGHHIHRHALVLIPKEYKIYEGGKSSTNEKKTINSERIENELREQWCKRTDGSFQIDLTPFYQERTLKQNLLEITKYITKKDKNGVINPEIILAVENNNRATFYHKFGCLYKVKALNINQLNKEQNAEDEIIKLTAGQKLIKELELYQGVLKIVVCSRIRVKKKKEGKVKIAQSFSFAEETLFPLNQDMFVNFRNLISNAKYKWRLEQTDRYDNKMFYEKWKEGRDFKDRFEKLRSEKKVNQRDLFF